MMSNKEEGFYEHLYDAYDRMLADCQSVRIVTDVGSPLERFIDHIECCIESLQINLSNHVSTLHE